MRQPTLFIPHGGGPCFFMRPGEGSPTGTWDSMGAYLKGIAATLPERPKAILIISGHWEERLPTIYAPAVAKLLFDYSGFPDYTYHLRYPAASDAAVAARVKQLLETTGFACGEDSDRGFDHGVFIPLMLMYPDADVPVVQLSLEAGYDAARHLAMGRALAPLRNEGVLIIGSGMSYHNLRAFGDARENQAAAEFDEWLFAAVTNTPLRAGAFTNWASAPGALRAHPQPEHLIPLFVAAGAALEEPAVRDYSDRVFGKAVSGFRFG